MFIPVSCKPTPKFPCCGTLLLALYFLPCSVFPLKSFQLDSPSGLPPLGSSFLPSWRFRSPYFRQSRINKSPYKCSTSLSLGTSFLENPSPTPSSKRFPSWPLARPLLLQVTWSLVIIWKFLPAWCSQSKWFLPWSLVFGSFSYKTGWFQISKIFVRTLKVKDLYALGRQPSRHHLWFGVQLDHHVCSVLEPRKLAFYCLKWPYVNQLQTDTLISFGFSQSPRLLPSPSTS